MRKYEEGDEVRGKGKEGDEKSEIEERGNEGMEDEATEIERGRER